MPSKDYGKKCLACLPTMGKSGWIITLRAKSSGTEIFEGRLCMNSADGWLILLSMLQSVLFDLFLCY
ncbi:hypothetical protein T4E_7640 [Trichinella pseudospiralis]|uniref:Uncharacterized protein n=1 Tax=Trichinella pseudospiralis TaxID=6337 RepID=A0A0V0XVL7_TRIPS|nr:hypothetical protein T4E_7640 [Trichinella pseudospiralis]